VGEKCTNLSVAEAVEEGGKEALENYISYYVAHEGGGLKPTAYTVARSQGPP
jgi:hypothetical protein